MKGIPEAVNQLLGSVAKAMPEGLTADVEKNVRAAMSAAFERMDLVTREELDVQKAVLARTREKLEQLEKQVQALSARLDK